MPDSKEIMNYLKELKQELEPKGIKNIGIFGSYAKDSADENSDIDILYETTDKFLNNLKGWDAFVFLDENLRKKVSERFGKKVDLFDLNSKSKIKEIVKNEAIYA